MINLLDINQVTSILNEIESPENIDRKKKEYKSFQIDDSGLYNYVEAELKKIFPRTYQAYTVAEYSVVKKINDKLAKAYKTSPLRQLATPQESELYNSIVAESYLNEEMKKLDRIFNRHNYALIGVSSKEDVYNFISYSPFEFDVVFDDLGNLDCVVISVPPKDAITKTGRYFYDTKIAQNGMDNEGQNSKFYALWTKENHILVEYKKDDRSNGRVFYQPIDNNPNFINPYGVIPFVYVPLCHDSNYPNALRTADQTIIFNALLSIYLTSGSMQVGQLVLKYPQDQAVDFIVNGLMTGMKLPQSKNPEDRDTTAEYIAPAPDMAGHKDSVMTYLQMILDERGISASQTGSDGNSVFSSGFDRLLSMESIREIIEQNQSMYSEVEDDLFEIFKAIESNYYGRNLFTSDELIVKFERPKVMSSESDILANIEKAYQLGVIEDWEKLVLYNPNLSEQDAKAKLDRINQSKRNLLNAYNTRSNDLSIQDTNSNSDV